MRARVKAKAFKDALRHVSKDVKKAKKYFSDKRLTSSEKTILQSFLLLRDSENHTVIEILSSLKTTDPYVESQRLFCLANAHNNLSEFKAAIKFYRRAHELISGLDALPDELFILFCFHVCAINSSNQKLSLEIISQLGELCKSEQDQLRLELAQFSRAIMVKDHLRVLELYQNIKGHEKRLNEHQLVSYQLDYFDFLIQEEKLTQALLLLEQMGKLKKFKLSSMMKVLKSILKYLIENRPFYLYPQEFRDYPVLYYQAQCLLHLEKGEVDQAIKAWSSLSIESPELYGEPFHCLGHKTLFSLAIKKLLLKKPKKLPVIEKIKNFEDKFFDFLKDQGRAVPKEEIYRYLYGEDLNDKDDLKKLVKVVQRVRKKFQIDIKTTKGSYLLIDKMSDPS